MALLQELLLKFSQQFTPASLDVLTKRGALIGLVFLGAILTVVLLTLVLRASERSWPKPSSRWFKEQKGGKGVVVIIHGWRKTAKDMEPIADFVSKIEEYENHGIYLVDYQGSTFSNKDPQGISDRLAEKLEELYSTSGKGEVVFIGHSLGGLIARSAYLNGLRNGREWAQNVSRIVLLAAPNRGTKATSRSWHLWLADSVASTVGMGSLIRSTYYGSPFVVNLRLGWLSHFGSLENPPLIAQLLGQNDEEVSEEDSRDVLQFPNSVERKLPNSTHGSIINIAESGTTIRDVLLAPLSNKPVLPQEGPQIKVLLQHGIRDYGERFREIGKDLELKAEEKGISIEASAPRIRFFSALQFINPASRRRMLNKFADRYTELAAIGGNKAPIYFVGHSFGTYLMAKSIEEYGESIKFKGAYFAGSVLDVEYFSDANLFQRVGRLKNDTATKDWPVGFLCAGLGGLGLGAGLGTAGFNGFADLNTGPQFREIRHFDGGHGEALKPNNRGAIVDWILNDLESNYAHEKCREELLSGEKITGERPYFYEFISRWAPEIFLALIVLALYLIFIGSQPLFAVCEVLVVSYLLLKV